MKFSLLVLSLLTCFGSYAQNTYLIDNGHSNIGFAIQWRDISYRTGEFKSFGGEMVLKDASNLQDATVLLTIESASIDVIAESLSEKLKNPEFMNSTAFPNIVFTCSGIKRKEQNIYNATGTITIKGVTKEVTFTVEDNGRKDKYAAIKVTGELQKSDFGITGGAGVLGERILITAYFELVRKKTN